VSGAVILASVAYLLGSLETEPIQFFMLHSELLAAQPSSQQIRVGGIVGRGSMAQDRTGSSTIFELVEPDDLVALTTKVGPTVRVRFRGTLPAGFSEEGAVIVRGRLENGVFESNEIITRCGKYERLSPADTPR
jgi:cytochrome c-type biogenesis protein CcmE